MFFDFDITALIVGILAVLALVSGGIALGLHLLKPGWTSVKRIMTAAGIATFVPMILPIAGLFIEADLDDLGDLFLSFLALLIGTGILWAIIGLPVAWWVTRRLERAQDAGSELGAVPAFEDGDTAQLESAA